ncbi:vitamin B12-dependent ribonucleotide reductase [Candidatus Woesearchaeota archaeon]|nr:vitamin B12-dependent ribonucleotide reductase [Candidatus Woesearchaeota archaeon]
MENGEILKIKKRNGNIVEFDVSKIGKAIFKAAQSVGGKDHKLAEQIASQVYSYMKAKKFDGELPSVENVQDAVEKVLVELGHAQTVKAYIIYRQERKKVRDTKKAIGVEDDVKLTINAIKVLEKRYLLKDVDGNVIETPGEMFKRVAEYISRADKNYGASDEDVKKLEQEFYDMMVKLEFLPNSPTFTGANTKVGQLSACFVLPIGDSMEEIFESIKNTALIHKSGGGTGFSFSRLRPSNDRVLSTKGIASGPVSFMSVFDAATETVKQGGTRRGANMGILRVDHPDIMNFISAKEDNKRLNNFNISIAVTDKFMEALENETDYDLINPRTKEPMGKLNAKNIFELMVTKAWQNGEPGIVFIDKINKFNPTPEVGEIESTNPCGEQPLLPYESCNLGSINLSNMVKYDEAADNFSIDYDLLKATIHRATHFLDNVIDMNKYPLDLIAKNTRENRKIGLGVMGFADMLLKLKVRYNSDEGIRVAEEVMKFIDDESKLASKELAKIRGPFPNFNRSIYKNGEPIRNATTTTIAPTGTLSLLANCSGGVEPLFAISYIKNIMDGTELVETNNYFLKVAKKNGFYNDELMKKIANLGSIQNLEEVPKEIRDVFVIAFDTSPTWHTRMQAAFQKHVDNAVSKTVNFSGDATINDVREAYLLSYKLGCKGVTVYRDGSREEQVLNIGSVNKEKKVEITKVEEQPMQEATEQTTATEPQVLSNDPNVVNNTQQSVSTQSGIEGVNANNVYTSDKTLTNNVSLDAAKEAIIKAEENMPDKKKTYCPECSAKLIQQEGCVMCPNCSYSACSM